MIDIFDFICVKNLKRDLLIKTLLYDLSSKTSLPANLFVSMLPPIERFTFIEFADFLPVPRYRDISSKDFLLPINRTFHTVFYLYKDKRLNQEVYLKFLHGTQEREYKGEGALEKGLKFDMIMDKNLIFNHIQKIWTLNPTNIEEKPFLCQLIKDRQVIEEPLICNYVDFYGNKTL